MKQYAWVIFLAGILLAVAGCHTSSDGEIPLADSSGPVSTEEAAPAGVEDDGDSEETASPAPTGTGTLNQALSVIPGAQELAEREDGLFLLKEYGLDMKWMEANQLEHLDRGTPLGEGELYFLLLPKYAGSKVEVFQGELSLSTGEFVELELLYQMAETPDHYGLILTSDEPESAVHLGVRVEYQGRTGQYLFSYDGRGERPAVQIFPQLEAAEQPKDTIEEEWSLFQGMAGDHAFQALIPHTWSVVGDSISIQYEVEGNPVGYNLIFFPPLGEGNPPVPYGEPEEGSGSLALPDGRICEYRLERDSPAKYWYLLDVNDRQFIIMVYFTESAPDPLPPGGFTSLLRPPSDVSGEFAVMLGTIAFLD